MTTICFETEHLQVRHLIESDVDDLHALCSDPVAMQYMDDGSTLDHATCAKWIDICRQKYETPGFGTSGIFERKSGHFVGFCGVVRATDKAPYEIIYALNKAYWGKGYATEATKAMLDYVFALSEIDTIDATIHEDNRASQHIMSKLRFAFIEDRREDDGSITKVYRIQRDAYASSSGKK